MKKLILILMLVCLVGSFAACGQQEEAVAIITPEPVTEPTAEQQPEQAAVSVPTVAPVEAGGQTEPAGDDGDDQVSRGNDGSAAGNGGSTTTNSGDNGGGSTADPYTVAQGYIGSSLSALQGAIGMPNSAEYVVSCLEDASQEGLLYYNGFMVWTIQYNDGTEIVKGVSQ